MPPRTQSRVECFFDGACPGNQFGTKGRMKAAFVIGNQEFLRDVPDLVGPGGPIRSNNVAEYYGLIFLLRHLRAMDTERDTKTRYRVYGDSELVIRQIRGAYRVKSRHLAGLHAEASRLASELDVEFVHVPREKNRAGFLLEARKAGGPKATKGPVERS